MPFELAGRVRWWTTSRASSIERPFLLGTVEHDDEGFAVHVHVVQAGSDEVEAQRGLAKALRADPALRDEYAALSGRQSIPARPIRCRTPWVRSGGFWKR